MKVFDSYDSSANKKRFPKEYVKYWELQFLFMATASKHSNQSLGFTYDDYGNYKDYIRKEMITFLKKSGLGIDYDKVKSGFYDKPAVSAEGKKTITTAKNYNDSHAMDVRKNIILLLFILGVFIHSLFATPLILERTVKNEVTGYDGKFYKENGTVTLFVNEFTSDKDGSKLGFAYAIESASPETPIMAEINGATKDFNSEQNGGWLIYYEKGDSFYIGSIWKNGYKTTVTDRSCFYEFDKNIGYDIYFMFCYLRAVNRNLTFENKILYTDNDHFWWDDNITAFTIRLSEFSDYAKYSKSHGNNPPYPSFKICLFHDSRATGVKIAENLKKGMWKTKSRNAGRPGSGLPQYGEITCWYKEDDLCDSIEEFCRHDLKRLSLVIDFAPVAVK